MQGRNLTRYHQASSYRDQTPQIFYTSPLLVIQGGRWKCNSRAMSCPPIGHYIAFEPVLVCDIDKLRLLEHTNKFLTFEKVVEYLGLLACVDTVDTIYGITGQLDRNWRVND